MNSAIETIARVQRAWRVIALSFVCVSAYSLIWEIKSSESVRHAVVRQHVSPVVAGRTGVECGHDVHQHPGGEEASNELAVRARFSLDQRYEPLEATSRGLTNSGVLARRGV